MPVGFFGSKDNARNFRNWQYSPVNTEEELPVTSRIIARCADKRPPRGTPPAPSRVPRRPVAAPPPSCPAPPCRRSAIDVRLPAVFDDEDFDLMADVLKVAAAETMEAAAQQE